MSVTQYIRLRNGRRVSRLRPCASRGDITTGTVVGFHRQDEAHRDWYWIVWDRYSEGPQLVCRDILRPLFAVKNRRKRPLMDKAEGRADG
jgi:hypothetical protein